MARTSMPSIPSVPLMSARPSLASSASGSMPALRARRSVDDVAVGDRPRPRRAARARSGRAARGRRCAERAVLGHERRDAGVEQREDRLGDHRPGARAAHRERAGPQQHHRPHDLALDRRAHAGGVRAHQRALQLARAARPGSSRWRASRSRSRRRRRAPCGRRGRATTAALASIARARLGRRGRPRAPVARDGDDVVGRESGAAELDHAAHTIGMLRRGP